MMRAVLVGMILSLAGTSSYAAAVDDTLLALRANVVRIAAHWKNGNTYDGFGFIAGARDGFLYVVTADHVVRGTGPDEIDGAPQVSFFQDQGVELRAELLTTRLKQDQGDLAVLRVKAPGKLVWRRDILGTSRVTRNTPVWFVGLMRDWFVPTSPGMVNHLEPLGTIVVERLNIRVGTSGAPLISDAGIVGMIVEDSDVFARATPIELIERAFKDWGYPWDLTASVAPVPPRPPVPAPPPVPPAPLPTPPPPPAPPVVQVPAVHECDRVAAHPRDAAKVADAKGVEMEQIDSPRAIRACREATTQFPSVPRFAFQLGRAFHAAKQYSDAYRWYRVAADQKYGAAQLNLGVLYRDGLGVAKDETQAVRLFQFAASQGYARAQNDLGNMYWDGRGGLAKNEAQAAHLYRLAAEQRYAPAQASLGIMYQEGRGGLAQSEVRAAHLYRLAAEHGEPRAQYRLGSMYEYGRGGLPRNMTEAIRLYRLAAGKGNEHAKNALRQLRR